MITGEFFFTRDGVVLDGVTDALYGQTNTVAQYDGNRDITVYGVRRTSGLFIHVTAHMNTSRTDAVEWYLNTNFEFRLNGGEQRYVCLTGAKSGVTEFYSSDTISESGIYAGKHLTVFEIYIAQNLIPGFANEYVTIAYAWKTGGETAEIRGDIVNAWAIAWNNNDWLARHAGGLDIGGRDFSTGINTHGTYPTILRIDENGLRVGEAPLNAVIDGDLSEYAGKESVTRAQYSGADLVKSVTVTGMAASDGIYLAFTVIHNGWSPLSTSNWSFNDNLEIRINNSGHALMFNNGTMYLSEFWHRGAAVTVDNGDGTLTTCVELFAASDGVTKSYSLQLGMNGAASGFNGWFGAIWDGNYAFITDKGVTDATPFPEVNSAYNTEFVLDGAFDDAVWTQTVKAKTATYTANGATVTVMGVNSCYGVLLGVTVVHSRPLGEACQGDGTEWWHFQNFEFRLMNGTQRAVSSYNDFATGCIFGWSSEDNGNGTYTTCYEILVPYYMLVGHDASYSYSLYMGGVYESGFVWFAGTQVSHYVTTEGIIAA